MCPGIVTDWLGEVFESDGAGAAVVEQKESGHGAVVVSCAVAVIQRQIVDVAIEVDNVVVHV